MKEKLNVVPQIETKILDNRLKEFGLPKYQTSGSAGMDLRAMLKFNVIIKPNETIKIPTGLAIHIQDTGICGQIIPRSGLGHKHGIVLSNTIGLIDSDYSGQLFITCLNRSNVDYEIKVGDRIAQLIFVSIYQVNLNIVESFAESERGSGGFGSTGV